jgi:two-component system, NtrC family, response regulator AtoC
MAKILIVDDQPMILKCLQSALKADGHDIVTVAAGDLALKLVGFTTFDIIITDYSMPRMDGIKFLEIAQQRSPGVPVIMITGYGTADTAMDAMAKGAFDYLTKPFSLDSLRSTVSAADAYTKARRNSTTLTAPHPESMPYPNVVAASGAMVGVCRRLDEVIRLDTPVLLQGEAGTGKELLARTIHAFGLRKVGAFAKIDCPKLKSEDNLARLLSGTEGGTVFFREVGALPMKLQEELLRIIQTKACQPSPDRSPFEFSARVISSTSVPLTSLLAKNAFLHELMRVLQTNSITVPPLRERPEDVRLYIGLMLRQLNGKISASNPIEPDALLILERYPWPGNLPELEEVVRMAITMAKGDTVCVGHLSRDVSSQVRSGAAGTGPVDVQQFRGRIVKSFLQNVETECKTLLKKIETFS